MEMRISPVDDCVWINDSGSLMVDGDTPKEAHDAAMKINNHERLVDDNAKMRKILIQLQIEGGLGIARHRQIGRLLNQLKEQDNE